MTSCVCCVLLWSRVRAAYRLCGRCGTNNMPYTRTIRNFALGPYAILLSDRTQFCSWTVRNFALGPYAILLSDRTQFCSQTVARTHFCSQTAARTRDLPGHRSYHTDHSTYACVCLNIVIPGADTGFSKRGG